MNNKPIAKTTVKKKPRSLQKPIPAKRKPLKTTNSPTLGKPRKTPTLPRCTKCGSRTVHLEQLQQELLATLSLHCLICGHHAFLGKPVVRLIRRPEIPSPVLSLKKAQSA